ncbi:MAG: CHAT domain-containing protein [Chitinophagaceae bacterium]|nr:CHAT domain-containing protein [Chitinophagaceae bacterium]
MRKQGVILIVFTLCYLFSMSGDPVHIDAISHTYKAADSLFTLPAPTDETDAAAKKNFDEIIAAYNDNAALPDSFLFNALWKRGVLEEVLGNLDIAKKFYLKSLAIANQKHTGNDSLEFKPLLYAGGIYYKENRFDSTRLFLEKAYALTEKYKYNEELERLYNSLGALYFDGGNYLQSKNCFEKALQIIEGDEGSIIKKINFETNIASSLNRLGQYEEALREYFNLLKYKQNVREISLNIGNIYMAINRYNEALKYFQDNKEGSGVEVFNFIANAHLQLRQYDSADHYLKLFEQNIIDSNRHVSKMTLGIHDIYKGDYLYGAGKTSDAAHQYQKAITELMFDYADSNMYHNPSEFSGIISSFNLYNAIVKKAKCFEALYTNTKSLDNLKAAFETYASGISLADHLERTMESDEAKIFLKSNSNVVYTKAIDIAMQLHQLTSEKEYLWEAYTIVEKNKSSVLVANLKDFEVKSKVNIPAELLQEEKELKYRIARLQIKMDQNQDDSTGLQLATEKRNDELKLSVVQNKIHKYTDDGGGDNFKVDQSFFKSKLKDETAILDLYFSDSLLYVFAITNADIKTSVTPVANLNLSQVSQVQSGLEHAEPVSRETSDAVVQNLFATLMQPVFPLIETKKEWIILPDGIFYYFPFEIIQNPASGKMLIEDYSISYNFSIQFINEHEVRKKEGLPRLIAVAPFINRGLYSYTDSMLLERLPATQMEIAGLNGRILMDTNATKAKFLKGINSYDILHLATHAVMNPGNPSQSYVAFYPQDSAKPDNYKLYLNELYNLNLDSTRLMLLSACETGVGKLVEGEGVMSLSRGVLYAGCPSVITTLWPANDQSTAYIINHFYKYMDDGNDLNTALRLSKLDFIKDYPNQKDPSYWAHLVLVGKTQSLHNALSESVNIPLIATVSTILIAVYAFFWYRKKKKPVMVKA